MKRYSVIYADPPWKYGGKYSTGSVGKRNGARSASSHYKVMSMEEIKSLPISEIAEDDAALFLWVTGPFLQEGLDVIRAWGFTYKTIAFCWVKLEQDERVFFGIGSYTKSNSELCLLGTRGNIITKGNALDGLIVRSHKESQVITTSRRNKIAGPGNPFHSMKPDQAYEKIERLFGDVSRIELFARRKREGWNCWGNQVKSDVEIK